MKANCINCAIEFKFSPSQSKGKYCSNACQLEYQRNTLIYERYLQGKTKNIPTIRKFLIKEHGYKCVECGIAEYNKKPITLQVDHIDGNSDNNLPSNVRLLCPNCHSQTPTYKGGNRNNVKNDKRNETLRKKYATMKEIKKLEMARWSELVEAPLS